jgi:putative hydrolase of the HAD superfamily
VELARRCGVRPSDDTLAAAVDAQLEGASRLQAPRPGALEVLAELKERGYTLGILSDCGSELCELWLDSVYQPFFDATVFSWDEGYRKPDPRGYLCVAAKLRVDPSECWYVGDGSSRELSGAQRLQMRPVLVTNEAYPDHARFRKDPDPFTPDDVIADITDLPGHVVAREPVTG